MKKIIICIIAVTCLVVMNGCAGSGTESTGTESTGTESSAPSALPQKDTVQPSESAEDTLTESDSSAYIGEDVAKAAALDHAGVTESEVTYVNVKLDNDNGGTVYDIEFYTGNTEYDYEIDAYTGDILSYDYDIENYTASSASINDSAYISLDEAKAIALNKANLTEEQVVYVEESFEYDDSMAVYQIDFIFDGMEYKVEINAADGTIVEYEAESPHD